MRKLVRILLITLLCMVMLCVTACTEAPEETVPQTEDPRVQITELSLVVSDAEELAALDAYPNLAELDLRGSTCYESIAAYIASHPQVSVTYDVRIGDKVYTQDTAELTLADGTYAYDEILERLGYLNALSKITLPQTSLSADQLRTLVDTYPDLSVDYSVMLLGNEVSGDTTRLDMSFLEPDMVEEAADGMCKLLSLTEVELMDADGKSSLSMEQVRVLMDAQPEADVHYTFSLFGKKLSTLDERTEYVGTYIGNDGVEQVRKALDIMPKCTYFLMDQCGVSNDVMAQLRDDYPETKIVWRITYGNGYSCLTDVTVFRCVGDLYDGNSRNLKYCTDIVYMDIGHCYNLSDLSFVSYMPNLKVAIVVDCYTSSLEPFAKCSNLEYLEIVNCNHLKDLSPLANCTNLKGLNMSYVFSITDLSPLYGLENLERLYMGRNKFPQETIDAVREALPNCWVTDYAESVAWISFNYAVGWRLDDEHTFAEWYKEIKEVFGYEREIY